MAGTHDTIVLVHGAGPGDTQGRFLTDVAEPLVRWLEDNGGEQLVLAPTSIRRGPRPARLDLTGRLPDPDRPGETRPFEWRLIEARWSDQFLQSSERAATAAALRGIPNALIDHIGMYDPVWRFWRGLTNLVGPLRPLANAPAPDADEQTWRYRFDPRWPLPVRLLAALWLGLLAPLLLLAVATPFVALAAPLWFVTGATAAWQRATWNGWYRLVLVAAWVPVLALATVLLAGVLLLALLPFDIPSLGSLRRGVLGVLRLRWLDTQAFGADRVSGAAIEEVVGSIIASELPDARTLTVIGYEQGAVIAYETLAALARPMQQPDVQNPYVTVSQALSAIDRPLPRYGLPVTLVTVGSALNRALGSRRRWLLRDPLPEGTRWIDVWSAHDPVAMGSVHRSLVAASGGPVIEARVTNTPSIFAATSAYWSNAEVAALIADEVIAASATRVTVMETNASPATWEPRAEGTWEWRARNGHADRPCTVERRSLVLRAVATVRAVAYGYVACNAWLAYAAAEGTPIDQLLAAAPPLALGAAVTAVGLAVLEPLARGVAERWAARPCRHTRLMPSAVRI